MSMIIHDDGHTNIVGADALEPISEINGKNLRIDENRFSLILTNPPFGSVVKKARRVRVPEQERSDLHGSAAADRL